VDVDGKARLIDAIKCQQAYRGYKAKPTTNTRDVVMLKAPKLPDHLIVKILIEQYKGRRGSSIAKSLSLAPTLIYSVLEKYDFIRADDGNHSYRKKPNVD